MLSIDEIVTSARERALPTRALNLITIDGPAGSGKTTLAHALSERLSVPIVHMESLYAGWGDALTPDVWQRAVTQILDPLTHGQSATFPTFDWNLNAFARSVTITPTQGLIIEGVGASHPDIRAHSCLSIWVDAPHELLLERVLTRDGEHLRNQMLEWQQTEQRYFAKFAVADASDMVYLGVGHS